MTSQKRLLLPVRVARAPAYSRGALDGAGRQEAEPLIPGIPVTLNREPPHPPFPRNGGESFFREFLGRFDSAAS